MESHADEIAFLQSAIHQHRQNVYALELRAISHGPLSVPLEVSNALKAEKEVLATRQERLAALLEQGDQAHQPPATTPPNPSNAPAPPPVQPTMHFGSGNTFSGGNFAFGNNVGGNLTQKTNQPAPPADTADSEKT